MQLGPISGFLTFMGNIDLLGFGILVLIFSVPAFFTFRRVFKKKFGDNKGKIVVWSIITSVLVSAVFLIGLLAGFVFWIISTENS